MLARAGHPPELLGGPVGLVAGAAELLAGVLPLVGEALEGLLRLLEPNLLEDELDGRLDRQVLVYRASLSE